MSKQKRSSSNHEEKASTKDSLEPELVKKICTSTTTTEIKEHVKDIKNPTAVNAKGNLKEKQEKIMMEIENSNIQAFVEEQMTKFEPPNCDNCPKRRADRVCVNKGCGNKYMQLICGKCHFDKHKDEKNKPEVDVEEFFTKLATFLNSQQYEKKKKGQSRIDTEKLAQVFDHINDIRQKLDSLKAKLSNEIEGYSPPSEMHATLQNGITKALSLCEFENIQEQLDRIKKSVLFENNKFFWNDASKKFSSFSKSIKELDGHTNQISSIISKSFVGGMIIDLNDLKCLSCSGLSYGLFGGNNNNQSEYKCKDQEISIQHQGNQCQIYLDYKLELTKKYKLRFRFEQQPSQYVMVGIIPYSQVQNQWCYNIINQYFCKRFFSASPTQECSRILRGTDLNMCATKGMKVEVRVDFETNYTDFADYPDYKNINANHENNTFASKEPYVFAFAFYQSQHIVIEQLEEISGIEEI